MIVQYLIKWSCRYCGNLHKWWRDSIDILTEPHDVNCTHCGKKHIIKVVTNQVSENAYCEITIGIEDKNDLQHFIEFEMPFIPNRNTIEQYKKQNNDHLTVDQIFQAWTEHDAMHYLSGKPFSHEGEEYIAYLEKRFNCGWLPFGEKRNPFYPRKFYCPEITKELILETADLIRYYVDSL